MEIADMYEEKRSDSQTALQRAVLNAERALSRSRGLRKRINILVAALAGAGHSKYQQREALRPGSVCSGEVDCQRMVTLKACDAAESHTTVPQSVISSSDAPRVASPPRTPASRRKR